MKKICQMCITLLCMFVITTGAITCGWKSSKAYGEAGKTADIMHGSVATRGVMDAIGSSMSKILDGILKGDFKVVIKESNKIAGISENMVNMFFPDDKWGLEGRKFKMADESMKVEYEKYVKAMAEATRNLADTSKNGDIVEVYEIFDSMLRNLCFECHKASRVDWPDWLK
ncbi:MAG: hypothetical protein ACUZ8I_02855 [Candidatus Scalindua sp.]